MNHSVLDSQRTTCNKYSTVPQMQFVSTIDDDISVVSFQLPLCFLAINTIVEGISSVSGGDCEIVN